MNYPLKMNFSKTMPTLSSAKVFVVCFNEYLSKILLCLLSQQYDLGSLRRLNYAVPQLTLF